MALRLAARGHEVASYTPLPENTSWRGNHDGVDWRDIKDLDAAEPGFWIIQRDPGIAAAFQKLPKRTRRKQFLAFACHDFDYPVPGWTDLYDAILVDSAVHGRYLAGAHKLDPSKIVHSFVGPMLDRRDQIPNGLVRDPKRLIWASSYVRGLEHLLTIYERALEWVPDLKLDICYGWESIDIAIPTNPSLGRFKEKMEARFQELPGITHHGRLGSNIAVWERYCRAGLWVYPTEWPETACQAAMIAQCFGAIPISTSTWALSENVRHGVLETGYPYSDRLLRAQFVQHVVRYASDWALQEKVRAEMIPDALATFDFKNVVDRIETYATEHDPQFKKRRISTPRVDMVLA